MKFDNNKNGRIETLKSLLASYKFSTQEDVLIALQKTGYNVTQATLSRDMKKLRVIKRYTEDNEYYYALPENNSYKLSSASYSIAQDIIDTGFVSLNFTGNLAVMKTKGGYATMIATAIDQQQMSSVVGTIAGHDTIFIALRQGVSQESVIQELTAAIRSLRNDDDNDF